jgi:hypothetical protein
MSRIGPAFHVAGGIASPLENARFPLLETFRQRRDWRGTLRNMTPGARHRPDALADVGRMAESCPSYIA